MRLARFGMRDARGRLGWGMVQSKSRPSSETPLGIKIVPSAARLVELETCNQMGNKMKQQFRTRRMVRTNIHKGRNAPPVEIPCGVCGELNDINSVVCESCYGFVHEDDDEGDEL
jgi:hypothetical protein